MKFSREIGNVTRIDESSLFLEGQNREVKMSIKEHKWKVITGILLELVIDHNFIPASELSQIPLIRLYLLIPPSPRLVSKFFTRWKLFETNIYTHIYIYKLLFFEINLQQISQTFFFLQRRRKSCNSTNLFSEPKRFKSLKKVFRSIVIRMSDNWDTLCN